MTKDSHMTNPQKPKDIMLYLPPIETRSTFYYHCSMKSTLCMTGSVRRIDAFGWETLELRWQMPPGHAIRNRKGSEHGLAKQADLCYTMLDKKPPGPVRPDIYLAECRVAEREASDDGNQL
jgi:hypothetical protein